MARRISIQRLVTVATITILVVVILWIAAIHLTFNGLFQDLNLTEAVNEEAEK